MLFHCDTFLRTCLSEYDRWYNERFYIWNAPRTTGDTQVSEKRTLSMISMSVYRSPDRVPHIHSMIQHHGGIIELSFQRVGLTWPRLQSAFLPGGTCRVQRSAKHTQIGDWQKPLEFTLFVSELRNYLSMHYSIVYCVEYHRRSRVHCSLAFKRFD